VLKTLGATGCPQVIHNLCTRRRSLPGRMVGRLPGACNGAVEQAHRGERFTCLSGFGPIRRGMRTAVMTSRRAR